jgi:hypothetical protein
MMAIFGHLRKLKHSLDNTSTPQYSFALIDEKYAVALNAQQEANEKDFLLVTKLNDFLGKEIKLVFQNQINCISCGRKTNKSFNQGYCYPCLNTKAQCDICIVKPELCHFDNGTCRDENFAKEYCNINHSLYISLTSDLKIGVTRQNQEQTRWVDQGASQALRVLTCAKRKHAGILEKKISATMKDKTNWRKMLKNEYPDVNLKAKKNNLLEMIFDEIENLGEEFEYLNDTIMKDEKEKILTIKYPVLEYPQKVTSFNLDKNPVCEGVLMGIKGQYLILDTGVINLRKYAGYLMEFTW